MSRNANTDPRLVPVQVNIRIPWYQKAALDKLAFDQGVSVPTLIVDAIDATYPEALTPVDA